MDADERKLFEYFIIAGLKDGAQELAPLVHESGSLLSEPVAPITDICVIFPGLGETVPNGYDRIETTPLGFAANLNHGSIRSHPAFLCFRRGYHKPPLVDLGILDEERGEKLMTDSTIIEKTPFGRSANVSNTSHGLFFTTRRSQVNGPPYQLVITHICVILENKNETPPHTYYKIDKNLNKGMMVSDVYICYKKSQICGKKIAYKPEVLDCFPVVENTNDLLTQNVPMFCLPMGAVIESWLEKCEQPEKNFSTCVFTDEIGTKYYGASLTFYEKYTKPLTEIQFELLELNTIDELQDTPKNDLNSKSATYYCNKSICIVSRYPFFESFCRFLRFIYDISITGSHKIPIERYISYLIYEVPFPSPSRPRVLVQLGNNTISFECHDDSQVPLSGATFVNSLENFGTENFMYAMLLALLEQKILVHSLRPGVLTSVSETICSLMFPFYWQCPYVPQCPLALAGVLHAPLPFIAGVDSKYFDLYEEPPSDVTCFDLDTATVSNSSIRKSLKLSMLPKKPLKRLRASLDEVLRMMTDDVKKVRNNLDSASQTCKVNWEAAVREAFLRFMCSLMIGYTDFLRPIMKSPREKSATDTGALFNLEGFIRSRDKNSLDFYQRFSETQCFIRFIEERSFVSDKNAYNVFFDDCIYRLSHEKLLHKEIRLLDNDALMANRTVVIPSPEMHSSVVKTYSYNCFPEKFDHSLFETVQILKLQTNTRSSLTLSTEFDKLKHWLVRTKQEAKTSLTEAESFVKESEYCWPKTMLFYAYSLWFLQLPSMIKVSRNKIKILKLSFKILCRMERSNIPFHDQVCYRILIYLCGEYHRPELATQVLLKMRRAGIQLNAVTYGIYHWALMQGDWPSDARIRAIDLWRRVRLRVEVCALFKEFPRLLSQNNMNANNTTMNYDESMCNAEDCSDLEDSPTRSLQALNISNNSLCNNSAASAALEENVYDEQSDFKYRVAVIPFDESAATQEDSAFSVDPLSVNDCKFNDKTSALKMPLPSVHLSPSRQRFLKEQSSTLFHEGFATAPSEISLDRKKKSFRIGSSWLKGITNSPMVNKFIGTSTTDNISINGSVKSENNVSGMSISPSLSSIVHQVRKQALKGYEVIQQGNILFKRSGINSLVNEAKNLNKSYSQNISGLSALSASDSNITQYSNLGIFALNCLDASFQLDSGHCGDILGAEFWMREILPQNLTEISNMWLKSSQMSFIDVALCSSSKCQKCDTIIYDEELIAGWTVEKNSNLNSTCPHCGDSFLPSLKVSIKRKSNELTSSWYVPLSISVAGSNEEYNECENAVDVSNFFTVTFLSPLILRRELESILLFNPLALTDVSLRATHPIIFWNLLYYCRRLDVPSHILTWVSSHVHIRCVFDIPSLHSKTEMPIYFSNHKDLIVEGSPQLQVNNRLWQQIVNNLQESNLFMILKYLINEHREKKETAVGLRKHFSIYRDILFVALDKFSRSVDRQQFDRQFQQELERLPPRILPLMFTQDFAPKAVSIACRRIFLPLDVI